jgi:hypothetical protein
MMNLKYPLATYDAQGPREFSAAELRDDDVMLHVSTYQERDCGNDDSVMTACEVPVRHLLEESSESRYYLALLLDRIPWMRYVPPAPPLSPLLSPLLSPPRASGVSSGLLPPRLVPPAMSPGLVPPSLVPPAMSPGLLPPRLVPPAMSPGQRAERRAPAKLRSGPSAPKMQKSGAAASKRRQSAASARLSVTAAGLAQEVNGLDCVGVMDSADEGGALQYVLQPDSPARMPAPPMQPLTPVQGR